MKNKNFLYIGALAASMLFVNCSDDDDTPVIDTPEVPVVEVEESAAVAEANLLLQSIAADGGTPYNADNPALTFDADENVFIPSVLGLDYRVDRTVVPAGPTVRLPMFSGWETLPDGTNRICYYVITESSDAAQARQLGVIFAPRMANAVGSPGVQNAVWNDEGRLVFEGSVDFSPTRSLTAGPRDGLLFGFPPAQAIPGAVASAEWSSYVVLPSGTVINAQMVANSTGIHDRIPNPAGNGVAQQDDLDNPNLSIAQASVVMQLLDGWHNGNPYYFHIVTDTSDPGPSAIELGVYASRLAQLPTFGAFPNGSMLPFSPTANGSTLRTLDEADGLGVQGLNVASLSDQQVQDPTNTFPIDPSDSRYAPMWDAHVTEFTVPEADRPILTSFEQINDLLAAGTLIPFRGNSAPIPAAGSSLSDLLTPTGAIINCPVISQPTPAAIGRIIGDPTN